jgi:cell division protein FtsB
MKFPPEVAVSAIGGLRRRCKESGTRVLRTIGGWGRILVERSDWTAPVVVMVLIGVTAAAVGVSGLESLNEQGRARGALAAEIELLDEEAEALRSSIASLRHDPAAFEVHAKTYHQLVEPGEVVVLLQPPGAGAFTRR